MAASLGTNAVVVASDHWTIRQKKNKKKKKHQNAPQRATWIVLQNLRDDTNLQQLNTSRTLQAVNFKFNRTD